MRSTRLMGTALLVLMANAAAVADDRSHAEGQRDVPAMVAAVVSISTRQIERDQFDQPVAMPVLGRGSSWTAELMS